MIFLSENVVQSTFSIHLYLFHLLVLKAEKATFLVHCILELKVERFFPLMESPYLCLNLNKL